MVGMPYYLTVHRRFNTDFSETVQNPTCNQISLFLMIRHIQWHRAGVPSVQARPWYPFWSPNFFFKNKFFEKIFHEYYMNVKQFESDLVQCFFWLDLGPNCLQKSPLAETEKNVFTFTRDITSWSVGCVSVSCCLKMLPNSKLVSPVNNNVNNELLPFVY